MGQKRAGLLGGGCGAKAQCADPLEENAGLANVVKRYVKTTSPGVAAHCRPCAAGCAVSQYTNHKKAGVPSPSTPAR